MPHVDTPIPGGMPQILQPTGDGTRLMVGMFQAGQVVMLDTTDPANLRQVGVVDLGAGAGPHTDRRQPKTARSWHACGSPARS